MVTYLKWYSRVESSITSITGQTTVVLFRAIRSKSGSNQPEKKNVEKKISFSFQMVEKNFFSKLSFSSFLGKMSFSHCNFKISLWFANIIDFNTKFQCYKPYLFTNSKLIWKKNVGNTAGMTLILKKKRIQCFEISWFFYHSVFSWNQICRF